MDYHNLIKRLALPTGASAPSQLEYEGLRAVALTRDHLDDDVAGINASLDLIRRTRGGRWPTGPVTPEFDYVDLVWHECEFREGDSFTYAVYEGDSYIGCAYLYPLGGRTPLTEQLLAHDVDVSWWVTPAAFEHGGYGRLYAALRHWLATAFPFWRPYYSNAVIPEADPR
jgi:hypothetical protein